MSKELLHVHGPYTEGGWLNGGYLLSIDDHEPDAETHDDGTIPLWSIGIGMTKEHAERIKSLWNAMLDIPDPQAFVAAARAMREALARPSILICGRLGGPCDCFRCAALAAFDAATANTREQG